MDDPAKETYDDSFEVDANPKQQFLNSFSLAASKK